MEGPPSAELPALEPSFVEEAAAAAPGPTEDAALPSEAAPVEADPAAAEAPAAEASPAGSRPATGAVQEEPADAAAGGGVAEAAVSASAETAMEGAAGEEQPGPAAPGVRRPKRDVHAWVVIRPGRREVPRPLLLDPATGLLHPLDGSGAACPCEGIEWAYNATNFFVNLQCSASGGADGVREGGAAAAHAVTFAAPELTDWSFSNPNCWHALLADKEVSCCCLLLLAAAAADVRQAAPDRACSSPWPPCTVPPNHPSLLHRQPTQECLLEAGTVAPCWPPTAPCWPPAAPCRGGVGLAHLAMGRHGGTPRLGGGYAPTCEPANSSMAYLSSPDDHSSLPPQHSSTLLASPLHHSSLLPPAGAGAGAAAAGHGAHPHLPAPAEMPLSWVPPLALSRERLDTRCPWGAKAVQYRQARRELFALHGECARWDGLAERLTTFADGQCATPLCVLELFQRRADRLERRQTWLGAAQRTVLSSFAPGAAACLKSLRIVTPAGGAGGGAEQAMQRARQGETELAFHPGDRPDALMRRLHSGSELTEHYLPGARPDRLIHRTALFSDAAAGGSGGGACSAQERPVACVVERYSRPTAGGGSSKTGAAAAAALEPVVVERVCDFAAGRLAVVWQVPGAPGAASEGPGATTSRTYDLGGALVEGDGADACTPEQRRREHAALWQAAQAAVVAVRAAESELSAILQARQREEQATRLLVPHYDAPREQVR